MQTGSLHTSCAPKECLQFNKSMLVGISPAIATPPNLQHGNDDKIPMMPHPSTPSTCPSRTTCTYTHLFTATVPCLSSPLSSCAPSIFCQRLDSAYPHLQPHPLSGYLNASSSKSAHRSTPSAAVLHHPPTYQSNSLMQQNSHIPAKRPSALLLL